MFQIIGPEDFISEIDKINTPEGKRSIIQGFDGNYYLTQIKPGSDPQEDGDVPAVYVWTLSDIEQNIDPGATLDFLAGFVIGMGKSGYEMGEGLVTLAKVGVTTLAKFNAIGFIYEMTYGNQYKTEIAFFRGTSDFALKAGKLILLLEAQGAVFLFDLFVDSITGDYEGIKESGVILAETFEKGAEFFLKLWRTIDPLNLSDRKQGEIFGRVIFEVLGILIPAAKAKELSKLSKAEFLDTLAAKLDDVDDIAGFPSSKFDDAIDELEDHREFIDNAGKEQCFIAGTLVHTANGLTPIEEIQKGDLVLAGDEASSAREYKTVLKRIVTHPDKLLHIRINVAAGFEEILLSNVSGYINIHHVTCTPLHPFYVIEKDEFIQAGDLEIGQSFLLVDSTIATITDIESEYAPDFSPFTTYNLDIADFNTYFVGVEGIWVHNQNVQNGKAVCNRIASFFHSKISIETISQALENIDNNIKLKKLFEKGGKYVVRFAEGLTLKQLDDAVTAADLLTYNKLKSFFKGISQTKWKGHIAKILSVAAHHISPSQLQKLLGLNADALKGITPSLMFRVDKHKHFHENILGARVGNKKVIGDFIDEGETIEHARGKLLKHLKDAYNEYEEFDDTIDGEKLGKLATDWLMDQMNNHPEGPIPFILPDNF